MSKTVMRAGRLVAAYVDDSLGRRVVLAEAAQSVGSAKLDAMMDNLFGSSFGSSRPSRATLTVGTTQIEVKATIATLYQLLEELPVGDGPDPRTRKTPIEMPASLDALHAGHGDAADRQPDAYDSANRPAGRAPGDDDAETQHDGQTAEHSDAGLHAASVPEVAG